MWSRVYFYAVIGTALSTAFFASPAKAFLANKVHERAGKPQELKRVHSAESLAGKEPVLGLPPDPQAELEELVGEVKREVEQRRRASLSKKGVQGKK